MSQNDPADGCVALILLMLLAAILIFFDQRLNRLEKLAAHPEAPAPSATGPANLKGARP